MVKITKNLARKMYNNGEQVMIMPNRVRADSVMASWYTKSESWDATEFDKLCNAIHYYNCSPETGLSLVYYAKEV